MANLPPYRYGLDWVGHETDTLRAPSLPVLLEAIHHVITKGKKSNLQEVMLLKITVSEQVFSLAP